MIFRSALAITLKCNLRSTSTTRLLLEYTPLLLCQDFAGLDGNTKRSTVTNIHLYTNVTACRKFSSTASVPLSNAALTKSQMDEIYRLQPQVQCVPVLRITKFSQMLINIGFSRDSVKKIVIKIPRILDVPCDEVLKVIGVFRKMRVPEKELLMAINECPELLMLMPESIEKRLKEINSYFTRGDARELLEYCPNVYLDSWDSVTDKIHYIMFEMGMEQRDIIVSDALRYGLEYIRIRHQTLLRTGKYQKPNPKNRRAYKGMSLKVMLNFPEMAFVKHLGITIEEYVMLGKILEEEQEDDDSDSDVEQGYRR